MEVLVMSVSIWFGFSLSAIFLSKVINGNYRDGFEIVGIISLVAVLCLGLPAGVHWVVFGGW